MVKYFSLSFIAGSFVAGLLLSGCSTDVELNAEWQETTVVYGLLDQSESYHFIRINKTFLGNANALEMAQVKDSSEYDPSLVDARIEEYLNGTKLREWVLRDTLLTDRGDEGDFYYPEYTAYYFIEPSLNQDATYRLVALIGSEGNKKEVTAETELVRDFSINSPIANVPGAPSQFNIQFRSGSEYRDQTVKYTSSLGSKRFNLQVVMHYTEVTGTDTAMRSIPWNLGNQKTVSPDVSESLEKVVSGENFYVNLKNRIESSAELNGSDVLKRQFRGIDFVLSAAADELNTFMELQEPVTGIVQERPTYTNVVNGIGIFSSRYSKSVPGKWLNYASLIELASGQYTGQLLFCVDTNAYATEFFYCP